MDMVGLELVKQLCNPSQLAGACKTGVDAYNTAAMGVINRDFMPREKQLALDEGRMKLRGEEMKIIIDQKNLIKEALDAIPQLAGGVGIMVNKVLQQRIQRRHLPGILQAKMATAEIENETARMAYTRVYFDLIREYLLLQCDLREMAQLGYPLRYMNQLATGQQAQCSSAGNRNNVATANGASHRMMVGYSPQFGYVPLVVIKGGGQARGQQQASISLAHNSGGGGTSNRAKKGKKP